MFISRVKSKGNYYFYAYIYDNSKDHGLRTVHSFGKKEKALSQLHSWKDQSNIPGNLIDLGFRIDDLDDWREKVENY